MVGEEVLLSIFFEIFDLEEITRFALITVVCSGLHDIDFMDSDIVEAVIQLKHIFFILSTI